MAICHRHSALQNILNCDPRSLHLVVYHHHHISLWGWGGVTLCCLQHCLMLLWPCWPSLGAGSFLWFLSPHTPRVDPNQTVSASGQGKGINRGGAPNPQGHRGPIQVWIALRRCSDSGRAAMRPIPFLAWQPAIPPFSGSPEATTPSFNGHLVPAGIK